MHKLLLADDSVTIQRVIELTFSGEDIQVIAVSDGDQAIARILTDQPDIVLADIGMPKQSGYDVAAFIKGRPELAHIPVLLLAGAFERVDEARAERLQCDGVLVKPFEPRQVVSRVRELVSAPRKVSTQVPVVVPVDVEVAPRAEPQVAEAESPGEEPPRVEPLVEASVPIEPPPPASSSSFLDESLDQYFERLNAAFADIHKPAPTSTGSRETASGHAGPGDSVAGYFDRLSAAFADLAEPPRRSEQLPASFDDLTTDLGVPTVDALVAERSGGPSRTVPGAAGDLETSRSPHTPPIDVRTVKPPPLEVPGHDLSRYTLPAPQPQPAAAHEEGGIAGALTALLAERDTTQPGEAEAPHPTLAAEPLDSHALVEHITSRVMDRLVPEMKARLRQLVLDEIEKVGIR